MGYYAALDIGTNNCRLLIAQKNDRANNGAGDHNNFTILDSYADAVLLGDALYDTGMISKAAMQRCIDVLKICANKIDEYPTIKTRAVATATCRTAGNGNDFIEQANQQTGLNIDIISQAEESRLACISCKPLVHPKSDYCVIFEIGGGSIQLSWVDTKNGNYQLLGHISLPIGILLATSRFGPEAIDEALYQQLAAICHPYLHEFNALHDIDSHIKQSNVQLISASGTPVTLACLLLRMNRYIRYKIDGKQFLTADILNIAQMLRMQTMEQRSKYSVIGAERMRLAGMGAALSEIILRQWQIPHIYIADRGQREGILRDMLENVSEGR
ncbi:MAG: hypothetical protein K0U45_05865 [Alphaproteobacteria bacterium]|nr:hypothetical protein [Alphaproteobacteria bacterium]